MKPGDTFLIPDGIGTHLNCVLALGPDNSLILCHFTTMHRRSDKTLVVLRANREHGWSLES
jgi:hypothetical protein